jgi:hypothetical protein
MQGYDGAVGLGGRFTGINDHSAQGPGLRIAWAEESGRVSIKGIWLKSSPIFSPAYGEPSVTDLLPSPTNCSSTGHPVGDRRGKWRVFRHGPFRAGRRRFLFVQRSNWRRSISLPCARVQQAHSILLGNQPSLKPSPCFCHILKATLPLLVPSISSIGSSYSPVPRRRSGFVEPPLVEPIVCGQQGLYGREGKAAPRE